MYGAEAHTIALRVGRGWVGVCMCVCMYADGQSLNKDARKGKERKGKEPQMFCVCVPNVHESRVSWCAKKRKRRR